MHELSLAESMVQLIEATQQREGFRRVRVVHLALGELACVEPRALEFAFTSASAGTCTEGATLALRYVPGEGVCPGCGTRAAMPTLYECCPACQAHPLTVVAGTQMQLQDLDVVD